ncbi:MAG: iron ABC transporter permease [Ectothiorhodospiraceae bacterium]|nr:iron ABC transporter permease [Ectothiorhodospiraceae bacterium]
MSIALEHAMLAHRVRSQRRARRLLGCLGALVAVALVDLMTGPAMLTVEQVLDALLHGEGTADPMVGIIVHTIRLPMLAMAVIVGASLGLGGAVMQTILGNPLASPYTLGFSAAAGFGAATVILFGLSLPFAPWLTVPLAAFGATAAAAALVYGFARLRGATAEILVLAGIATLFLFQSLQSLLQYLASPEVLQQIVFWLFGSLIKASWSSVAVSGAILAVSLLVLLVHAWPLTALAFGDERARSLGIDVERLRVSMLLVVSLLTAGAVAFVGTIGFVGLVAPHLARILIGDDQRHLLPMSALCGATLMTAAAVVAKVLSPGSVVPIGIVTAVVGVPFLFVLIVRGRSRGE